MRYVTLLSVIFPALASAGTRGHLVDSPPATSSSTQTHTAPNPAGTNQPGWWDVGPHSSSGDIKIKDNVKYQYMVIDWLEGACTVKVTCAGGNVTTTTDQYPQSGSSIYLSVCSNAGNYVEKINADCD
ncbi:hypothetical protein ACMFMG_010125 [Clarireedia jacksonii]